MAKKNVFDNERIETLAVQYKRTGDAQTYQRICAGSNDLMDAIIRSNKDLLRKVPYDDLKQHLFLQIGQWITKWTPSKGKIYTYFSTCIKNGCKSYLTKEMAFQNRFAVTDVPLDSFASMGYVAPDQGDKFVDTLRRALDEIYIRWNEPHIQEIVRYCVGCVVRRRNDQRKQVLRTITLGWDVSADTAKFLLDWSQAAVRAALLDHYNPPLGGLDILRTSTKFSFIPDLVNVVGMEKAKQLLHIFCGMSIRFPSMKQLRRQHNASVIYEELLEDPTPDKITELSKRYRMSAAKVEEAFTSMAENIQAGLLDDTKLYESEEEMPAPGL